MTATSQTRTAAAELSEEAERAVELARAKGADDAVATASSGRSTEFVWRDGAIETVQESASRVLSLRLYVDGRYSTHATNDLRPQSLGSFVEDAVALTRALEPDPHRVLPEPSLYAGRSDEDLELLDPAIDAFDRETSLAWLAEMDAIARGHANVVSASSRLQAGGGTSAQVSSNGFAGTEEGAALWYGTEVTARDAGDRRPEAAYYVGARHVADLPPPAEVATEARRRALERLGSTKGPTQRTTMVVDREAATSLVARLLGALSGGAIQQKRSFLAGKLGESIATERLTLLDEPLRVRGLGSRHFDREGIAARRRPIVEAGALRTYFLDTYYARKLGAQPTTSSASNVVVVPGERDLDAILRDVGDAIYVTSWLGGNADGTTGDFSFGLQGLRVGPGGKRVPIGEMNVTGSFLELFARLVEVGSDPNPYARILAPTLVFEDVQFSGA